MSNAHLYGFALSYPAGAEPVTGYAYEPWHWRYIGTDHAAAWKASGLTLVEYLRRVQ
jgi:D-alanyl-D-alanine carboxypeptidase